jgi:hypothetical protein
MAMPLNESLLCVSDTHADAEKIIRSLSASGVDMTKLSLIGKGYHSEEHPLGFYTAKDRMKAWGGVGAFWGGLWGLLLAPAVFVLPGFGLVAMGGPVVAALFAALEGAVLLGGASAIGAALTMIGVPEHLVIKYETALKAEKYVLIMHGNMNELARARSILSPASVSIDPARLPALQALAKQGVTAPTAR